MARPKLGTSPSVRLQMVITQDEIDAIDEWRQWVSCPSRSAAIRDLVQKALTVEFAEINASPCDISWYPHSVDGEQS